MLISLFLFFERKLIKYLFTYYFLNQMINIMQILKLIILFYIKSLDLEQAPSCIVWLQ